MACKGAQKCANITIVMLLLCGALNPTIVVAFKPNEEFGHGFITRQAIIESRLGFCQQSENALVENNFKVDHSSEFLEEPPHCDGEKLVECTQRIVDLFDSAVGKFNDAGALLDFADSDPAFESTIDDLAESGWAMAGKALHTLQDFYAHSNYVRNGTTVAAAIHPDVGRKALANNPLLSSVICEPDFATLVPGAALSSGYFPFSTSPCTGIPEGKCRHGVFLCSDGLNKDDPSRPLFFTARRLARTASARFLTDLHDKLASDAAREVFLGRCGISVAFVIDTTGSMSEEIQGVLDFAAQLANVAESDASLHVGKLV